MAIRPLAVGRGALRGQFGVHTIDIVHQHLRSDDAGTDTGLRQRVLGELLFLGALGIQRLLPGYGLRIRSKQFHGLIQQRYVADGEGRALRTRQRLDVTLFEPGGETAQLLRFREQLVDQHSPSSALRACMQHCP